MASVAPFGTWASPLSAADLAAGTVRPGNLAAAGRRLAWTEARPSEGGRQALVVWDGTRVVDATPPGWNTRTRVHEYGGAPFVLADDLLLASRWEDQRLHRVAEDGTAVPVTAEGSTPAAIRWADGRVHPAGRWLAGVREAHEGDAVANQVVALDLDTGAARVVDGGRDFVAAPRWSPDGRWLAWLAWDHPNMPWDGAELWVARVDDGVASGGRRVLGAAGASAQPPTWLPDGRLVSAEDGSGFWEVHVGPPDGELEQVSSFGADVGGPLWQLGSSWTAALPDGRLVCSVVRRARGEVHLLDVETGIAEAVDLPYRRVENLRTFGDGVAGIGVRGDGTAAVFTWAPADDLQEVRRYELPALRPGDAPSPEPVEFPTPDGATTHAWLYLPVSADTLGPEDDRPPLVVFTHGGPTGNVHPTLTSSIAYWTTRGFAVADVNYRGSTGFGRAYRDALREQWGVHDVTDTITVARGLAAAGTVDGARMAIRGGSAGGYTTLMVLTEPDHPFACGTSFFGVADLALLAAHTHKFESRYLDQVVGPLPETAARYRERSPLHRAARLSRPLLVLQGLEDAVVPPEQSEAMVAAAAERGVPHAYLAFEGEQHGFRRAENIVTWLESELAFYGRVMGFTPAGDLPDVTLS